MLSKRSGKGRKMGSSRRTPRSHDSAGMDMTNEEATDLDLGQETLEAAGNYETQEGSIKTSSGSVGELKTTASFAHFKKENVINPSTAIALTQAPITAYEEGSSTGFGDNLPAKFGSASLSNTKEKKRKLGSTRKGHFKIDMDSNRGVDDLKEQILDTEERQNDTLLKTVKSLETIINSKSDNKNTNEKNNLQTFCSKPINPILENPDNIIDDTSYGSQICGILEVSTVETLPSQKNECPQDFSAPSSLTHTSEQFGLHKMSCLEHKDTGVGSTYKEECSKQNVRNEKGVDEISINPADTTETCGEDKRAGTVDQTRLYDPTERRAAGLQSDKETQEIRTALETEPRVQRYEEYVKTQEEMGTNDEELSETLLDTRMNRTLEETEPLKEPEQINIQNVGKHIWHTFPETISSETHTKQFTNEGEKAIAPHGSPLQEDDKSLHITSSNLNNTINVELLLLTVGHELSTEQCKLHEIQSHDIVENISQRQSIPSRRRAGSTRRHYNRQEMAENQWDEETIKGESASEVNKQNNNENTTDLREILEIRVAQESCDTADEMNMESHSTKKDCDQEKPEAINLKIAETLDFSSNGKQPVNLQALSSSQTKRKLGSRRKNQRNREENTSEQGLVHQDRKEKGITTWSDIQVQGSENELQPMSQPDDVKQDFTAGYVKEEDKHSAQSTFTAGDFKHLADNPSADDGERQHFLSMVEDNGSCSDTQTVGLGIPSEERPLPELCSAHEENVVHPEAEWEEQKQAMAAVKLSDGMPTSGPDRLYNVVLVGNSGVGKTSFMKLFQSGKASLDNCATVGIDSCTRRLLVDREMVLLQLWDTAGQERYRSMTKQILRKAQALLLMYDITSVDTFSSVRYWISCVQEGVTDDVIIMLLGNKSDRSQREVPLHDGKSLAQEYGICFMECSAATGDNVTCCVESLARMLKAQVKQQEEAALVLRKEEQRKTFGCC